MLCYKCFYVCKFFCRKFFCAFFNIKVYIGAESNIDDDVTVIKTRFKTPTEEGTIAIVGPKRMEYDQVVSMLEYMKENIER